MYKNRSKYLGEGPKAPNDIPPENENPPKYVYEESTPSDIGWNKAYKPDGESFSSEATTVDDLVATEESSDMSKGWCEHESQSILQRETRENFL